jgi:hypothetical protein
VPPVLLVAAGDAMEQRRSSLQCMSPLLADFVAEVGDDGS